LYVAESDASKALGNPQLRAAYFAVTTPKRTDAGTDAKVTFRIAQWAQEFDGSLPGVFEQGTKHAVVFNFMKQPGHTVLLNGLRGYILAVDHDNTGSHPGWYLENVALYVLPVGSADWVNYKEWKQVGWLQSPKLGVILQDFDG
jgi:hypothetical protein